jgi:type II secretory pathway pseudopilin PulG
MKVVTNNECGMKFLALSKRRSMKALTVIELLLALMIIAVLVAMLMPFAPFGSTSVIPRRSRAKMEISDIANAVKRYQTDYGKYPVSSNVQSAALMAKEDFTCGGSALNTILGSESATTVNADVIAIIMDITINPVTGEPTINRNHNLNLQQIQYLVAKIVEGTNASGVGRDLVYRDPWGHPYIISMDLNGDSRCRDVFYRNHLVSKKNGAIGFDGLTNVWDENGMSDLFEYQAGVLVWSLGPDGKADKSKPANVAPNKDNVVSWR